MGHGIEMDSDTILDLLGNDTRRKILEVLSEEPMYFSQLAKEVGVAQQAVLRHLQALEEGGLIKTYSEKSDLGAPDRKYYQLNNSFILTITLSKDDFMMKKQEMIESRHRESHKYYKVFDSTPENSGKALCSLQENLLQIEEDISMLQSRLNDLYYLKQQILERLHKIGIGDFEFFERKILYTIVEESPDSLSKLSDITERKEGDLKEVITGIKHKIGKENARELLANFKY